VIDFDLLAVLARLTDPASMRTPALYALTAAVLVFIALTAIITARIRRPRPRLTRAQMAHDRKLLIADLDESRDKTALLEVTVRHLRRIVGERDDTIAGLVTGIQGVRDQLGSAEGATLEEVDALLADITSGPRLAQELRVVDVHDPAPALDLIRERTRRGRR
jgi:hypothetical protein